MCIGRHCSHCIEKLLLKKKISAREQALCQLTVCFEFQSISERRKGHKSHAQQMASEIKYKVNC